MPFDVTIPDINIYTEAMVKSAIDKIFFLDKMDDASIIVDYGCADGAIIGMMKKLFPDYTYIGYDVSEDMIEKARIAHPGVEFHSEWETIETLSRDAAKDGSKTCLVLSSVIHEEMHYGSETEKKEFWGRVWGQGIDSFSFDYVAIRDMMTSRTTSRPSDPLAVARVRQLSNPDIISQWERTWGSLHENWSLTHFLLKYRYVENWARELKENYLPIAYEDFMASIPKKYVPIYTEHYTLPFIRNRVRKDFGIELADRTHLKLILAREDVL